MPTSEATRAVRVPAAPESTGRGRLILEFLWPVLVPLAIVAAVVLLAGFGDEALKTSATYLLVYLIAVVGLYAFTGLSGVLSFGHAAFMGFGCYFTAIMTIPTEQKGVLLPDLPGLLGGHMGTIPALLVAAGLAFVIGYVLAIPLMRLSGLPAGIATLAILVIANVVMNHWDAVTRGNQTFIGAPVDTNRTNGFVWAAIAIVGVYLFQRSRFGFRLQASREDELAAAGVGVGVHGHRRLSFALSAAVVAIAGGLYGHLIGVFSPDSFYVDMTFLLIVMLVLGGVRSLAGAVVGTVVVMMIQEVLQRFERGFDVASLHLSIPAGVDALVLAAILGVVIVLRPDGITRGREFTLPRPWSERRRQGDTSATPQTH